MAVACLALLVPLFFAFRFQKQMKTDEDWNVARRDLPTHVVAFSQFATMIGGAVKAAVYNAIKEKHVSSKALA